MTRTTRKTAEDNGVTATAVVELSAKHDRPIIRTVTLHAANGQGVTSNDLHLLEGIGLRLANLAIIDALPEDITALPDPPIPIVRELSPSKVTAKLPPVQRTPQATRATKKAASARKPAAAKAATKAAPEPAKRVYRAAPVDSVLVADYKRTGGSVAQIAELYGVPKYTAQSWVNRLRRNGLISER